MRRPPPRPTKPVAKLPRMAGVVQEFNSATHDLVVRSNECANQMYVNVDSQPLLDVKRNHRVVFLDRRPDRAGFTSSDEVTTSSSRILTRVDRGREPVIYVMVGVAPPKPIPDAQMREQVAAYKKDHGQNYS